MKKRGLSAYGFAHAEVKKSNFSLRIRELVDDTGIIFNDF